MKILLVAGVLASVLCATIQAQDIPPKHKEAAKQAFAKGSDYYIWYEGKEPLTLLPESSSAVFGTGFAAEIRYLAKDQKTEP